jgi:hypothetical protein
MSMSWKLVADIATWAFLGILFAIVFTRLYVELLKRAQLRLLESYVALGRKISQEVDPLTAEVEARYEADMTEADRLEKLFHEISTTDPIRAASLKPELEAILQRLEATASINRELKSQLNGVRRDLAEHGARAKRLERWTRLASWLGNVDFRKGRSA